MNKKKTWTARLSAILFALVLVLIGIPNNLFGVQEAHAAGYNTPSSSSSTPVKKITVSPNSLTLEKNGDSITIKPTIEPSDATEKKLTYKSSEPPIVSVDSNGKITAMGEGTAVNTITSADGKVSTTVTVTVKGSGDNATPRIMYRLYNPNSGEHFYTSSLEERNNVIKAGWNNEGIGWIAPTSSTVPVYRLYNTVAGDHHYTTSVTERDHLTAISGWNYEGIGWYSATESMARRPLYREYNPNATTGTHNYTMSPEEHKNVVAAGWHDEGLAWFGLSTRSLVSDIYKGVLTKVSEQAEGYTFDPDVIPSEAIGGYAYILYDINGDGLEELIVGARDQRSMVPLYQCRVFRVAIENTKRTLISCEGTFATEDMRKGDIRVFSGLLSRGDNNWSYRTVTVEDNKVRESDVDTAMALGSAELEQYLTQNPGLDFTAVTTPISEI